jgi:PAS domain S-box-containing protein
MSAQKILVVEDETITALDIERSLQRMGYVVAGIAGTGEEAVQLARQHQPNLVLMDIRLRGEIDGVAAAQQIHDELQTPIVFLTAYADCATLQRAKSAEPFAYLLKPFEEAVLATTIEVALHKHQVHQTRVQNAAEALHLSQERFDQLADNVSDYAISLLNPSGEILTWSAGAEKIFNWNAGEVLGKPSSWLYPPEDIGAGKPQQDLESAARHGRLVEYNCQMRKDHVRFSAQTVLIALRNVGGEPAGFLKLTREVVPVGQTN